MHTEVFNNIDTLISMANSPLNIDEINTELISLKRQINNKKGEIDDLKSLMTDARYFNASNELVDKNIEISLKNKINRLNRKIKDIKATLEEIKAREKSVHEDITSLKTNLELNSTYLKTLEDKVATSTSNNYYQDLLLKEQNNIADLTKELEEKTNLYNSILEELNLNNQAETELTEKLTTEQNRLNDIMDNLKNPNAYIDEDLKNTDNERLALLESDLQDLEKRKLELLTDASMIAADAKELIINNDIIGALSKIKELVTIVKSKPYMDIKDSNLLNEELEKKESLRTELSSLIDSKNYEELDNTSLNKRLSYIKENLKLNEESIANYQKEIATIDEYVNSTLGANITFVEKELLTLEKSLTEYKTLLKDKTKPSRIKANLENVITKKEKERTILNDILNSYKDNLLAKISRTNTLNSLITELTQENNNLNAELNTLNKLSMLDLTTKDLVSEEEDKEKLKQVNEEIKALKNRQKFTKTPDEIYDEIDMSLATLKENAPKIEPPVDTLEDTTPSKTETSPRLKVIQVIPVETVKDNVGGI